MTTLEIERLDGGLLRLDGWGLASEFFATDPSSSPGGYDSAKRSTSRGMIETPDILALNQTMRARSPHAAWSAITGVPLPWLAVISLDLDLIETGDDEWAAADGATLIGDAMSGAVGKGRGPSVATKMLHLKRPRLFPIIDGLVVQMLGGGISGDATSAVKAEQATRLILHLRVQGRRNLAALETIRIRLGQERSLVRILDAVLWSSHSAVNGFGSRRVIDVALSEEL